MFSGSPDDVDIGLIMANASSQYENAAATPGWFSRAFGYISHLFEGYSKGDDINVGHLLNSGNSKSIDSILLDTNYNPSYQSTVKTFLMGDSIYHKIIFSDTSYIFMTEPKSFLMYYK